MDEFENHTETIYENTTDIEWVTAVSTLLTTMSDPPPPSDNDRVPFVHRVVVACCLIVIIVVGFFGNALVIASVVVSPKLRTTTNIMVVNLAVADFATCLLLPFMVVGLVDNSGVYPLPEIVCSIVTGVGFVCIGVSCFNLAAIAFIRWYVITRSIRGQRGLHTNRKILTLSIIIWLLATAMVVVPLSFKIGEIGYSQYYSLCSVTDNNPLSRYFVLLQSAVTIGCLVLVGVFYVLILTHVLRQNHQFRSKFAEDNTTSTATITMTENQNTKNKRAMSAAFMKREIDITKNLFMVVCVFVLCYLPNGVNFAIPGRSVLTLYGALISTANSAVNPIIYGLKHPNFQAVFKSLLLCRPSSIDGSSSTERNKTSSSTL